MAKEERITKKPLDMDAVAAVVDDNGYVRWHEQSPFSEEAAREVLRNAGRTKVFHGATILTGEAARKAIRQGRV